RSRGPRPRTRAGPARPGSRAGRASPRWRGGTRCARRTARSSGRAHPGQSRGRRRGPGAAPGGARTPCGLAGLLRLERRLVVPDEGADVVTHVEELRPLLLVEGDGEAPEAVDRDRALLADLERDAPSPPGLERRVLRLESVQLRLHGRLIC